mgnify:CR=1 FL=1
MPTTESSANLNEYKDQAERLLTKQALRFSVKNMSKGYILPHTE